MKARKNNRFLSFLATSSLMLLFSPTPVSAQSSTWITDASANWSASTNWSGGIVADGADNTANFTSNISAARTITLDSARTIGNIVFTDSVTSSHNLTISGANTLTLDRTTGTPTINVTQSGRTLAIGSVIDGADGLLKSGPGQLTLSGANTYGTNTIINEGILALTGSLNGTGLTFTGAGTFNVQRGAGITTEMGALALNAGDATVTSTAAAATSIATLTFNSLSARSAGATSNFTLVTNTSSTSATPNRITFAGTTNVPLASGSSNPGLFFGGASYARYDAAGFVRAVTYGTDTNAPAALSGNTNATLGTTTAATDTQFTGAARATSNSAASASGTNTNTLNVANGSAFAVGQILTGTNIAANTYITAISTNTLTLAVAGGGNAIGATAVAANTALTPYNSITAQSTGSVNTVNLSGTGASIRLATGATLSVNGIMKSGAGNLGVISGGTALQTTASGGDLVVRTNASGDQLIITTAIANNGGSSLTKSGAGTLFLPNANTYAGGTFLNGGTLTIGNATSLGTAAATVSGASTLRTTAAITYANALAVNAGLTLATPTTGSSTSTFSGVLSGSAPITLASNGLGGALMATFAFTNASNTFAGDVILPSATGSSEAFSFASIGDGGNFTFTRPSWREMVIHTGAAPITFNNRQISLASTIGTSAGVNGDGNPVHQFSNNATNAANTVTFNSNMVMPTSIATSTFFTFGGSNAGNNTFAGIIGDPGGANTLGILKWDGGRWILSNSNNAYEGNTWIANGTLSAPSLDITANNQPLGKGSLILLGQGANNGILEITGANASTTNKQVQVGNSTAANTGAGTIRNEGAGDLTFTNSTFNPTIAGITATRTLTLGGNGSGLSTIEGVIQNNATGGLVELTKSGSGTWRLGGVNTFSGNINVTGGTLAGSAPLAFGLQSSARTITVAAGATVRYDTGNIYQSFSTAVVPTYIVAGTVVNNFANNNAIGNVTLNGGTITATAGSANYGAFRFNATVTSTGNSTISTSEPVSGGMMLRDEGSVFDVTSGTLTISAPLGGILREGQVGALVKNGAGALVLSGENTYRGSSQFNAGTTTVSGSGTLGSGVAALAVNNAGTTLNLSTTLDTAVGSLSGTGAALINHSAAGRNFTVRQTTAGTFAGTIAGDGNFTLGGLSTNTLTLSGSPSFTGSTTVNGGTLRLDYSTNDVSKLSDTAALVLGGGTVELSGGTHTEVVASTTLTAGTASRITSSTPGAVIALNTISNGAGASLDIAADNIATTDTLNTNGILGTWATVGGTNWATNSTNTADGLIVAYSGYTDVARLDGSSQVINDNSSANVRIIEGTGAAANNTLGSATTAINSLLQSAVGGASPATIAMAGQTLRANSVLVASGAGELTFGTAPNSGTLTTAAAGGSLILTNNSIDDLIVNSVIADNTSASGLAKFGTGWLVLTGNNTYTGATDVSGGVLNLSGSIAGSAITVRANAELKQETTGLLTGATSVTHSSSGTSTLNGANTHSGGTTLNTGNLIIGHESALGTGTFTITGGGFNTNGSVTSLTTNNAMTWNGSFSYNGGSALNLGTGAVTLAGNSQVSVSSNTLTVDGVIGGAFTLTKTGAGTLVLNGANVHSGGTFMSGASTAGTLILGHASALGTGPVTFNSLNDQMIVDTTIPNFVNANNNAINFQGNVIFAGSQNMDLGTGPVTLLANRTVTINANTLKFGGGIGGAFNFTKAGDGQLNLSGVNTYTGTSTFNGAGAVTISGTGSLGAGNYNAAIANNSGFVFASSASQILGGVISGAGPINKSASSTLSLRGANAFTGPVTVSAGTLVADVSNTGSGLSAADVSVASGATAVVNVTTTAATAVTNVGNIFTGAGELRFQFAANTAARSSNFSNIGGFTGSIRLSSLGTTGDKWNATNVGAIVAPVTVDEGNTIFISSGTGADFNGGLILNGAGNSEGRGAIRLNNATLSGNIQLASSSTINLDNAGAIVSGDISSGAAGTQTLTLGATGSTGGILSGVIGGGTGTINLETAVGGTYTLTDANTYTGTTIIGTGSTLRLGDGTTGNDGTIANPAGLVTNGTFAINYFADVSWSTVISGTGGFTKQGTNVVTLSAANTFAGATTVSTGTLKLTNVNALQSSSGGTLAIGTTLHLATDTAFTTLPTFGGASGASSTTFISDRETPGVGLTHSIGTPNLGNNTFLFQAGPNVTSGTAGITMGGIGMTAGGAGTTNLSPVDATVTVTGPVSIASNNFAKTLQLAGQGANHSISGDISNGVNTLTLTKDGSSTWTLSGANTYTGVTTVTQGSLIINGSNNVAAGGTTSRLVVGATSASTGALTIGSGAGMVNFGGDGYTNAVQVGVNGGTGSLTLNGGTVSLVGNAGTASASLNIGVQLTAGAGAGTGTVTVNNGTLNVGQRILLGANEVASSGTLTISGGTVDVGTNGTLGYTGANPGVVFLGSGTATVNLDGGSLNVFGFKSHPSGTSTIHFNGGTLVAKGSPAFFMGNNGNTDVAPTAAGTYNTVVKSGGAIINTNGFNITIPSAMVTDPVSTGGGLTKNGAGTLTLSGANTYTGATSVVEGTLALVGGSQASPVAVSAGASLGFTLESPTTSTGTFNLSAGTIKITGTPTLNSYDLISSSAGITGTPVLDAPITGYELKVDGNSLKLVKAGYASWAAVNAIGSAANLDKDADGVSNGVEYVLGGDVNTNDLGKLPTLDASGANLVFTFKRDRDSLDGSTAVVIEVGDNLTGWPDVFTVGTTTGTSTAGVTVTESSPEGFDTITLSVPKGVATKKFARLKVTVTE